MPASAATARQTLVLLLVPLCGCQDLTAPFATGLTPAAILSAEAYSGAPQWMPGTNELLYSTASEYSSSPPARLEAIRVSDGARRTIVTAMPGGAAIFPRSSYFSTRAFVYFRARRENRFPLYRSRLDDTTGAASVVLDSSAENISADDRFGMGIERSTLITLNIPTGEVHKYSAPAWGTLVDVSVEPTGRGFALVSIEGVVWLDTQSGRVQSWTPTDELHLEVRLAHTIVWVAGKPVLYVLRGSTLSRYFVAENKREDLGGAKSGAVDVSWSSDGSALAYWTRECTHTYRTIDGGKQACDRSVHTLRVLRWSERRETESARIEVSSPPWGPWISPASLSSDGAFLAFTYKQCGDCYGGGVYVRPAR